MDVDESNRRQWRRWGEHQQGVECDWRKDDTTRRRSDRAWREGDVGRRGSDGFEGRQETDRDRRELPGAVGRRGDWRGNFGTTERHRGWREKTESVSGRQGFYEQRPVGVADEVENWRQKPNGGRDTHETWRERHGDRKETARNPRERSGDRAERENSSRDIRGDWRETARNARERSRDRAERENSSRDIRGDWRETTRNARESPRDNVREEGDVSQKEGRGDWKETVRNPRESPRDNVMEERDVSQKEGRGDWRETARNPRERSRDRAERENSSRDIRGDWRETTRNARESPRDNVREEGDVSQKEGRGDWKETVRNPRESPRDNVMEERDVSQKEGRGDWRETARNPNERPGDRAERENSSRDIRGDWRETARNARKSPRDNVEEERDVSQKEGRGDWRETARNARKRSGDRAERENSSGDIRGDWRETVRNARESPRDNAREERGVSQKEGRGDWRETASNPNERPRDRAERENSSRDIRGDWRETVRNPRESPRDNVREERDTSQKEGRGDWKETARNPRERSGDRAERENSSRDIRGDWMETARTARERSGDRAERENSSRDIRGDWRETTRNARESPRDNVREEGDVSQKGRGDWKETVRNPRESPRDNVMEERDVSQKEGRGDWRETARNPRERSRGRAERENSSRDIHGDWRETARNARKRSGDRAERENSSRDIRGDWRETVRNARESPRDNVREERDVSQKEGRGDWRETARNPNERPGDRAERENSSRDIRGDWRETARNARKSPRDNVEEERDVSQKEGRGDWRETARNARKRSGDRAERENSSGDIRGDWRETVRNARESPRDNVREERDVSQKEGRGDWRETSSNPNERPRDRAERENSSRDIRGDWRETVRNPRESPRDNVREERDASQKEGRGDWKETARNPRERSGDRAERENSSRDIRGDWMETARTARERSRDRAERENSSRDIRGDWRKTTRNARESPRDNVREERDVSQKGRGDWRETARNARESSRDNVREERYVSQEVGHGDWRETARNAREIPRDDAREERYVSWKEGRAEWRETARNPRERSGNGGERNNGRRETRGDWRNGAHPGSHKGNWRQTESDLSDRDWRDRPTQNLEKPGEWREEERGGFRETGAEGKYFAHRSQNYDRTEGKEDCSAEARSDVSEDRMQCEDWREGNRTSAIHEQCSLASGNSERPGSTPQFAEDVLTLTRLAESSLLSLDNTRQVLQIVQRTTASGQHREDILVVLQKVCTSQFLDKHLPILIRNLPVTHEEQSKSESSVVETVKLIHLLVANICQSLPSYASKCILLLTYLIGERDVMSVIKNETPSLEEDLKAVREECEQCAEMVHNRPRRHWQARQIKYEVTEDSAVPPQHFTEIPIFPTHADLDWDQKPFLRPNKAFGAYRDVDHYLDVHFRLLREDYIRPLREGLKEYRQMRNTGSTKRCRDLRIYRSVRVVGMTGGDSLEHFIQFDVSRLGHVHWQTSKRLPYGALLCLTQDDFETMYLAVVTHRDPMRLPSGFLQVEFESRLEDILQVSAGEVFTMAETPAYFEAYRHVLEALQLKVSAPYFPMERYIVKCQRHVLAPASGRGKLNLNAILRQKSFHAYSVPVNEPGKWPTLQETGLDASQLEALQNALTNELAIIQGPPGTGKTYVGLKITEVLLNNRDVWTGRLYKRPILVVCYTNHALDQFLEGILRICPSGVIRVGSRCKSPALEKCNLREAKRRAHCVPCELRKRITTASEKLSSLRGEIEDHRTQAESVQNLRVLCHKVLGGSMLPGHYESLHKAAKHYLQSQSLMKDWLTFGGMAVDQEGERDPYFLLAREVTSRILGEKDTLGDGGVDPTTICSLPYRVRAQLYRFWHAQVMKKCSQATGGATGQNLGKVAVTTTQSLNAQSSSDQLHQPVHSPDEILPDKALKSVMNRRLYTAITGSMLQQHKENKNYCIRAWLGVHPSSAEMKSKILQGGKACREEDVSLEGVLSTPRRIRVQLYRSWLQKVLEVLHEQFENSKKSGRLPNHAVYSLKTAQSGILPDWVLKPVVSKALLSTIQRHMLNKHKEQKCYMIRAWLGIDDFSQDACALEKVLEKLTGKRQDKAITTLKKAGDGEPEDTDIDTLIKQTDELRRKISPRVGGPGCEDDWTIPDWSRQPLEEQSQSVLKSSKPMTVDEASAVQNVWDITMKERVRLYLFWVQKHQPVLTDRLRRAGENYVVTSRRYRELKLEEDVEVLKEATVIGMTTTRAARYHQVLDKIRCPIVILEEAAEVLEAHVVTTLHKSCQHLILIGDHQQLRPSPTVYELCRHYQLDLSLFERLVNNKLPHSTLAVQHRMRPEVARLVRHVYPHLEDHEVTLNRPHIRGMKHDVFLFDHEVSESTHRETNSKYNEYEADMVMKLCEYLRLQGYKSQSITVLTAYTGQLLRLKAIMQADMFRGIQVTSVDNFQGEENDVIILSLVRSNEEGSVGFLGTDNRVCVALSRARNGLYAFGNFRILSERSKLWRKVVTTAKGNGQFGRAIVLRCENHPDTETHVSNPRDFKDVPEGGCKLPCDAHLHCGHSCRMLCHGYDRNHTEYRCMEQCQRQICKLDLHPCPKKCHERCGTCQVKMEKIPQCGHTAMMGCSTDPGTWTCPEPCEETLPCGHRCSGKCGQCRQKSHVTECKVQVERMWECGHLVKSHCHVTPGDLPCPAPCGAKLDCGHDCPGTCGQCLGGRVHVPCKKSCGKALPGCGHKCTLPCGTKCLPCTKKCRSSCKHGTCTRQCGDPCQPCTEPCEKKCEHRLCGGTCDEPCVSSSRPCTKTLKCGHWCRGYCGEECVCRLCDKTKYVRLSEDFLCGLCGVSPDGTIVRRAGRNEDNPHVPNTNGAETDVIQGQGDPDGSDERKPANVTPDEGKLENVTPDAGKPENVTPGEGKHENVTLDEEKPENVTPDERKPENVTSDEEKPENVTPDEEKPENVTPDERKPENVTPDEGKPENVTPDEEKSENVTPDEEKPENVTPDEEKPENVTPDAEKPENVTPDEGKPENVTPDEGKPENLTSDEGKPKTSTLDDRKPENVTPEEDVTAGEGEHENVTLDERKPENGIPDEAKPENVTPVLVSDDEVSPQDQQDGANITGPTLDQVHAEEADQTARADVRLIKLPRCGHVFDADALDAYVVAKLGTLPPGRGLSCPVCDKPILVWDCWSYSRLLRKRHSDQQEAKKKLKESTSVSEKRKYKITTSLCMLPDCRPKNRNSFSCRHTVASGLPGKGMNVNEAFALTTQCRLITVVESVRRLLTKFPSASAEKITHHVHALETVLVQPMQSMSDQRFRELTAMTRRLAYMAILSCAKSHSTGNEELVLAIDSCLQMLEGNAVSQLPTEDMDKIFAECKKQNLCWETQVQRVVNVAILDAPSDEDLCDIVKTQAGFPRKVAMERTFCIATTTSAPKSLPRTLRELRETSKRASSALVPPVPRRPAKAVERVHNTAEDLTDGIDAGSDVRDMSDVSDESGSDDLIDKE